MDGEISCSFLNSYRLSSLPLIPFQLVSAVSGMFWMKSHVLPGHWQVVGHLCPSVNEELQPFAENSIMTDVNFYGKFYQAKEGISFLPVFCKVRWWVRKQRLASVFGRIFLFSTGMPANEKHQPHLSFAVTGVKMRSVCVAHLGLGGMD